MHSIDHPNGLLAIHAYSIKQKKYSLSRFPESITEKATLIFLLEKP